MTTLLLSCGHELREGDTVVSAHDGDGYRLVAKVGDVLPLEDLVAGVQCDECGADVQVAGVR